MNNVSRLPVLLLTLLLVPAAHAQDANRGSAKDGSRDLNGVLRPQASLAAEARMREIDTLRALSIEGQALYAADGQKRDLAIAYGYAGDLERAQRYAEEALGHYVNARNRRAVHSWAYKVLGDLALRRGDAAKAVV